MAEHRQLVIGFQGSGKTTFAAALWYLVDAREVPTVLVKGRHNGDFRYLEKIASAWANGWQADHTASGIWQPITISLRFEPAGQDIDLSFVDMSGETFERVFVTREFDDAVEGMAHDCGGLLLFVTALRVSDDVTIVDVGAAFPDDMPEEVDEANGDDASLTTLEGEDGLEESSDKAPLEASPDAIADFVPGLAPRQVQLTDLLDAFADPPVSLAPSRVAVVVSAWDRAPDGMAPERWLAERMPLLDQYLRTHANVFEMRVYGVSAQGGVLPKKGAGVAGTDRNLLLAERIASRRIRIVGHDAGPHDLTHPIAWLSGLEQ